MREKMRAVDNKHGLIIFHWSSRKRDRNRGNIQRGNDQLKTWLITGGSTLYTTPDTLKCLNNKLKKKSLKHLPKMRDYLQK